MPYQLPPGKCIVAIVSRKLAITPDERVEVLAIDELLDDGSVELPDNADLVLVSPGLGLLLDSLEKEKRRVGARIQIKTSDAQIQLTITSIFNPALVKETAAGKPETIAVTPAPTKPKLSAAKTSTADSPSSPLPTPTEKGDATKVAAKAASILVVGADMEMFKQYRFPVAVDHWTKGKALTQSSLPESYQLVLVDGSQGKQLTSHVEFLAGDAEKPWKSFPDTANLLEFLQRYTIPGYKKPRPLSAKASSKVQKGAAEKTTLPKQGGWSSARDRAVSIKPPAKLTPAEQKLREEVERGLAKLRAREAMNKTD